MFDDIMDTLEEIADQNYANFNDRGPRGNKIGKGHYANRKTRTRGRFKRIKKKPVTLPSVPWDKKNV